MKEENNSNNTICKLMVRWIFGSWRHSQDTTLYMVAIYLNCWQTTFLWKLTMKVQPYKPKQINWKQILHKQLITSVFWNAFNILVLFYIEHTWLGKILINRDNFINKTSPENCLKILPLILVSGVSDKGAAFPYLKYCYAVLLACLFQSIY